MQPGGAAMITLLAALALPGESAGQNRQPISTSLAECSAIYGAAAEIGARRGRETAEVRRALAASDRFLDAAVVEARQEGIAAPADHVARLCGEMSGKWSGRLSSASHFLENRDWLDYCDALGRDRGVLPLSN